MDKALKEFIFAHGNDDTASLLLKYGKDDTIDVKTAASQIEARRKANSKIPYFCLNPDTFFPTALSVEQCSSEAAAMFKRRFVPHPDATVCDLTGGLGVDSYFFSRSARKVFYFEKNTLLAEAAAENFNALGASNISVTNADCEDWSSVLKPMQSASALPDLIFVDPSRRDSADRRKYALEDCSPNILKMLPDLFSLAPKVLVKASPMLDITFISKTFPNCRKIVALSVDNECKEVLMLLERDFHGAEPQVDAVDLKGTDGSIEYEVNASLSEEREAAYQPAPENASEWKFLYQPGKAMLKAGFFKLPCSLFGVTKVDPGTHLYIGGGQVRNFPGKAFRVLDTLDFSSRNLKSLGRRYPKASLTALNVPLSTAELKSRTRIEDGGNVHIFACGFMNGGVIVAAEPMAF